MLTRNEKQLMLGIPASSWKRLYILIVVSDNCLTGWKESFSVVIGGDEVTAGKPSPEM